MAFDYHLAITGKVMYMRLLKVDLHVNFLSIIPNRNQGHILPIHSSSNYKQSKPCSQKENVIYLLAILVELLEAIVTEKLWLAV